MKLKRALIIITAAVVTSPAVFADITMQQSVKVSASGGMSMMGSQGTVTTMVSGQRGRTENQMESTSKLMKKLARNMNTASIVSLDEGRLLNLNPEKQQYSEITFEELRAQMEKSMEQLEQMDAGAQSQLPVSEDECQWSEPEMTVDHTGEKQKFAGVKASQSIISVKQVCMVPDSGKSCDMTWNMEYWNAKRIPGKAEITEFQKGMAKAMGSEEALGAAQVHARGLMAMFKEGWDDVLKASGELDGYPVKTVMTLQMGGENCTTSTGQPIAMDDVWGQAAEAGLDAATHSAAAHAGSAVASETAEAVGGGVGGSIAGSAIGAASRELMSGAFSKFRKKKKKPEPEAPPANPAAASVTLFKIDTELTAIDKGDIPDSSFIVPAGWEKIENTGW